MLSNSKLTVYHKKFDINTRMEKWERYNYDKVWWFGGKGAGLNAGYDNANDVNIRIAYADNNNLDINHFAIGDIVVKGSLILDINTQQDLENYEIYNITSISDNTFGTQPHIHLGGK